MRAHAASHQALGSGSSRPGSRSPPRPAPLSPSASGRPAPEGPRSSAGGVACSSLAEPRSILERGRGLGRSDWTRGLFVCLRRRSGPPPGPRGSVPGSSEFHSQAGPGSGPRVAPAVSCGRCAEAATPVRPECGWAARVPQTGAWSVRRTQVGGVVSAGARVTAGEGGKGFAPRAGVPVSSLPLYVLGASVHFSGPGALRADGPLPGPPRGSCALGPAPAPGSRCGGGGEGRAASPGVSRRLVGAGPAARSRVIFNHPRLLGVPGVGRLRFAACATPPGVGLSPVQAGGIESFLHFASGFWAPLEMACSIDHRGGSN